MQRVDVKEKARERELRILKRWQAENTFQKSIDNREGQKPFVFYEGPPTANGKPHIGHVLGRVIKDFIGRYQTMVGHKVIRKAGWDTHGLPVELGVEKQLGISGKQEIENYGVEAFVQKCKDSVFVYEKEWRKLTEAIGYWTDMDNPYITLKNSYIESVWHILSTIHQKGLLYKGHRVSPYCPCCQTTLSSHEVAQGYEDVKDLSATVKFRSKESGDAFLAWTTTPWTLPANAALAINPSLTYARVQQGNETYIIAHSLVNKVMKGEYEIISTHPGSAFIGVRYEAPFAYVVPEKGHFIVAADFVSDTSGTGIVHMAPAHGEDDYRAARQNDISMIQVVDKSGHYTDEVEPFAGRFVKECDVDIVKSLAQRNLLFHKEKYEHSYPFCWRCKSPLLYYAMESWFINTTAVKEQLISNNNTVNWYPDHIREGRFGKFLEDLVDWNISRNRYWGTPLNVWECTSCEAAYAPHSHADLREKAIHPVAEDLELHKPYVDEVKLACPSCSGTMERTPEVIDVWFDSGSMPFAQQHYPFENQEPFAEQYPADMICEGVDQTRGWFFSLLTVSTLFTGKAPYKAVISTGHILDENGQKMSKSKGNVFEPWDIIDEFGADAFRWALLSDSAPWNSKRFSKQIVIEAKSKVVDTLQNTHAFYTLYAKIDGFDPEQHPRENSVNQLDRWILSRLNSMLTDVRKGLGNNDFLNPARAIEGFIDDMSNWYIRRSRDRFWGSGMSQDKIYAYQTLHEVLVSLSKIVAPFTPFIAEEIYSNLEGKGSVHLADYPEVNERLIDERLEQEMQTARQIVELARNVRNETGIKTRQPLSELIVSLDQAFDLEAYEAIIKDEINVKTIRVETSDSGFIDFTLKLNLRLAGPKFGKNVGVLQNALRQMGPAETKQIIDEGQFTFTTPAGDTLIVTTDELLIEKQAKAGFAATTANQMTVALHTEITEDLKQEGWVREVVRVVQDYRKKLDLPIEKRINLVLDVDDELKTALQRFEQVLRENVLLLQVSYKSSENMEVVSLGDKQVGMVIHG
ncbi:isoleucine--tRNA ligase [Hazenella sp. IB182353]|uniref:isoleucine--tRNA ligase n=1 Tax=Polycladospora coralii TaxID=2771432 RepID=UPI001745E203|nr:isoleucine--tRNA ligase [Polycladospora coralii]MBS7531286.1 isoleucine--tRNA ligase [Polycladospora coralii]